MAYLPGFKHDIFISYAHDNNPGAEAGAGGRITRLHRLLEERLRELTGRELDIWRDTTLARNQEFDKTIRQAVEDSGIFLAVNSTAYRNSSYCKQEIEWFAARTQEDGYGLSIVDRRRIFNLLLEDIHYNQWPPSFQGATQYNFFEKTPGDTVTLPAEPESDQFKSEFNVLLRNLCRTLRDFKEVIETRRRRIEEPPPPSDQKFTVFLADTSEDLRRTIRRRLINELLEKGVRLAESVPPPLESEPHDEKAVAEINRSHLCVHLFDASPGRDIEDTPDQFFTHRQVELGKQRARAQLIWLPNSIDYEAIAYEPHRKFLQSLENAKRDSSGYRFIREPLTPDAVVREIMAWRQRHDETWRLSVAKPGRRVARSDSGRRRRRTFRRINPYRRIACHPRKVFARAGPFRRQLAVARGSVRGNLPLRRRLGQPGATRRSRRFRLDHAGPGRAAPLADLRRDDDAVRLPGRLRQLLRPARSDEPQPVPGPRMTRQQRQQAIEGPIRLFGGSISPRLLDRALNDVGDKSDQLPVMQHALMRTWE
jgi:hypothetical protein